MLGRGAKYSSVSDLASTVCRRSAPAHHLPSTILPACQACPSTTPRNLALHRLIALPVSNSASCFLFVSLDGPHVLSSASSGNTHVHAHPRRTADRCYLTPAVERRAAMNKRGVIITVLHDQERLASLPHSSSGYIYTPIYMHGVARSPACLLSTCDPASCLSCFNPLRP